ncbi:hypothetical protein NBZ79_05170 [Sneathiella marina]|uniref:Phasin domain-containing protein n=1 Tax=Sneathiella marina TaxID=2950108 RepID=A0ABY4W5A2_9PROT|nr:hypothetical protein [Sneathiella marina]USG62370.1 hypothetical protein NBZ79_05170 [Sneathiella marina]
MSQEQDGLTESNGQEGASAEMPAPPNLETLFQSQTQQIDEAIQKANKAFEVFTNRDQEVTALTQTLSTEVNAVFLIAAAAQTPQLAAASIPAVLALANAAFATVPVTQQKAIAEVSQAFVSIEVDRQ